MTEAGKPQLFRPQVLAQRRAQSLGPVLLAPRASHRAFALLAAVAAAGLIALLFFADFTRKARVSGWLVPDKGLMQVYGPRSGVVTGLHVAEGVQVAKGEPLLTVSDELQSASLGATQAQITRRLAERRESVAEERRRQDELLEQQGRALSERVAALRAAESQIEREIALLKSRTAIAESAEALHRQLHRQGFISAQRLNAAEADKIDQRARQAALERDRLAIQRERAGVEAELRDLPLKAQSRIGDLERSISQLEQELAEAEARREIVVPAPQSGTVTAIQAVVGGHVGTDVPLLAIVPSNVQLEAHLYSPSRAIGFVRPGQPVLLRYQAYAYQRFGHYEGVVTTVSRSGVNPSELPSRLAGLASVLGIQAGAAAEPLYRITVRLASQTVNIYGEPVALQPGMLVEADVLLEKRRLIQWVFDPLYSARAKWTG